MAHEIDSLERCYKLQVLSLNKITIRSESLDRMAAIVALMRNTSGKIDRCVLPDRASSIGPDDALDAFRYVIDSVKGVTIDD